MGRFHGAVIGIGQFCAIVLIVFITAGSGAFGYLAFNAVKNTGGYTFPQVINYLHPGFVGMCLGAIVGFLVSMFFAATLFALVEIAKNTSERWFP